MELIYNFQSTVDPIPFSDLFNSVSKIAAFNWENYARLGFRNHLTEAAFILWVLYDENNRIRSKLEFYGAGHPTQWFSKVNLINSSNWDIPLLKEATIFEASSSGFQIGNPDDSELKCQTNGFVNLACDLQTPCNGLKWWLDDESLIDVPCGAVYSKLKSPIGFNKGFWASKLQILTKNFQSWEKVLRIEAFAGVDPFKYMLFGETLDSHDHTKTYRDEQWENKILKTELIKFQVYDFSQTNVVSEMIFRGSGHVLSWFSVESLVSSSLWSFDSLDPDLVGSFFSMDGAAIVELSTGEIWLRRFYINQLWAKCPLDYGWVMMSVTINYNGCPFEMYWNNPELAKLGFFRNMPPYILYTASPQPQLCSDMQIGGKIEIHVKQ